MIWCTKEGTPLLLQLNNKMCISNRWIRVRLMGKPLTLVVIYESMFIVNGYKLDANGHKLRRVIMEGPL